MYIHLIYVKSHSLLSLVPCFTCSRLHVIKIAAHGFSLLTYYNLPAYSIVDNYLDYFQFGSIVNNPFMTLLHMEDFCKYIPFLQGELLGMECVSSHALHHTELLTKVVVPNNTMTSKT